MSTAAESGPLEAQETHVCPGCAGLLDIDNCGVFFDRMTYGDFSSMPIFRRMTQRYAEIRSEFRVAYPNLAFSGVPNVEGAYADAAIASEAPDFFEGYNRLSFSVENNVKTAVISLFREGQAVGLRDMSSSTPVCPNCGFVLPVDFFQRHKIYIGMIGASSSGKTVAISVLARRDYACLNYAERFAFSGMYNEADPGYASVYQDIIQDIDQGILPAGTQNHRIPPLLVKLDITSPKGPLRYLIAFVDAAGEAFPARERIGFLNYCNGYVLAIEAQGIYADFDAMPDVSPSQGHSGAPKLASEEEARALDPGGEAPEATKLISTEHTAYLKGRESEAGASYSITNPDTYVSLLNNISFAGTRNLAVVMTKADLLPQSEKMREFFLSEGLYKQGSKGNFIFDFDRHGKKSRLIRQAMEERGISLRIDSKYNVSYFAVSATGKQPAIMARGQVDRWHRDRSEKVYYCSAISPKNLYEPFMWLILNALRSNGELL